MQTTADPLRVQRPFPIPRPVATDTAYDAKLTSLTVQEVGEPEALADPVITSVAATARPTFGCTGLSCGHPCRACVRR